MRSRFAIVVALAAGCQFSPGANGNSGDGSIDGRVHDAPLNGDGVPIDAAPDAPPDGPAIVLCVPAYTLTLGGHSYRKTPSATTRAMAKANCEGDGGHLIKIETAGEDTFAYSQFSTGHSTFFWIGLTFSSNAWSWDDGTALGSGYHKFMNGIVPTNPDDPCVDASPDFANWSAYSCTNPPHQGLCECDGP